MQLCKTAYIRGNMFRIKLLLLFIFTSSTLLANMRSPWVINRYPSYSLTKTNTELKVLKEDLNFYCDRVYEGDPNYESLLDKKCKVEVAYTIQSNKDAKLYFEFILPSEKDVFVSINNENENIAQTKAILVSDTEKEGYRLSDLCRFCEKTINSLYSASFSGKMTTGENIIKLRYDQPLAVSEISYGYFKSSKWSNSFSYELWPLKEWKLDPNFKITIKFSTEVGGYFERFYSEKISADCRGIDLRFSKIPSDPFKKEIGSNGFKEYYEYNQNLNPMYLLKDSKTSYEKNRLVYELSFTDKFPDRLQCFFGKEK